MTNAGALTIRIVVTGPECTGKTTLAGLLAERFGAQWIPEAARAYAAARPGRNLAVDDVEPIARLHMANEGAVLSGVSAARLLFLDTDLLSTVAYSRHYYGASSEWLEGEARSRIGALYLLCEPDLPWTADGIRDRPSNHRRMFAHFEHVLGEFGASVRIIGGEGDARTAAAERAVAGVLAGRAMTTHVALGLDTR
ncbi:MAG: ATP-binding protein [Gemmatimonadetes bacterium]|nr:ATP-binding protein [Gemmatimonadota bacterium]